MDNQLEVELVKSILNRDLNKVVDIAYQIKPYNDEAVQCAKLIADWFDKDISLSFDKTINRFLGYAENKNNPLSSVCYYMAAKIYLFNKMDAQSALNIVRKAIKEDDCFPGVYYLGAYIYQAGLVGNRPNYPLACSYLIDSCKSKMPWFESYHVLDKRDASIQVKLHYATKTMKHCKVEEFRKPSFQYLASYYIKNNYLKELDKLFIENIDHPSYYEGIEDNIGKALYSLYSFYYKEKNYIAALQSLEHASMINYDKAIEALGTVYFQGLLGVKKDEAKAVEYLKRVKSNGAGKYLLGVCYEKGIAVEKDFDLAYDCYLKSAKSKFPEALYRLGKCFATGDYKNKDEYLVHRYFEEYLQIEKNVSQNRRNKIEEYYNSFKK